MNKLVIILSLCSYISCATICGEDGLFANTDDSTSYYECVGGKPTFKRCPISEDGLVYLVFEGKECVDNRGAPIQPAPPAQANVENSNPIQLEQPQIKEENLVCPPGSTYDSSRDTCVREEVVEPMVQDEPAQSQTYECPTGLTYDATAQKCRGVEYADPISVAAPPAPSNLFKCPRPDGMFPSPNDVRNYFICENDEARLEACPQDTVFNRGKCRSLSEVNAGLEVYPESCPNCIDNGRIQPRQVLEPAGTSCPSGTVYDAAVGMCRRDEITEPIRVTQQVVGQGPPQCPTGTIYDIASGLCRQEVLVQPIRGTVETGVSSSLGCQTGFTYNPVKRVCERSEYISPNQRTCPFGTTWDYAQGFCVGGSTIGTPCRGPSYCPSGYTMDSLTRNCSSKLVVPAIRRPGNKTFECDPSYIYDWVLHKCLRCQEIQPIEEKEPGELRCPDDFYFNRNRDKCLRTIWITPIKRTSYGNCTCPPGYEWRPNMFQCVRIHTADCITGPCPPVVTYPPYRPAQPSFNCPAGTTYDYNLGECTGPFTRGPARPRSICESELYCPTGFIMDYSRRNCSQEIEIPPVQVGGQSNYRCTNGYTYDPIFHKCRHCDSTPVRERDPGPSYVCPSNGFGHFVLDQYTRECTKTIWTTPIFDYTNAPCDCPTGYYWSFHIKKCVRIEIADCMDAPCPNLPPYPNPPCPPGQYRCASYSDQCIMASISCPPIV